MVTSTLLAADRHPAAADITKLLSHLNNLIRTSQRVQAVALHQFELLIACGGCAGNSSEPEGQDVGVQCLEGTLRTEKVRAAVWAPEATDKEADGPKLVDGLVQLLRSSPSSQMQYQLGFCFWLLTFDQTIAQTINA